MAKGEKSEKTGNPESEQERHSSRLDIEGSVSKSLILVVSGVLLPPIVRNRVKRYKKQRLLILEDLILLGIVCCLVGALFYLYTTISYFGTEVDTATSSGVLLIVWQADRVFITATIAFFALLLLFELRERILRALDRSPNRNSKPRRLKFAFFMSLITALVLLASHFTRGVLVGQWPKIAQLRADQLVRAKRFDMARDILMQLPSEQREPIFQTAPEVTWAGDELADEFGYQHDSDDFDDANFPNSRTPERSNEQLLLNIKEVAKYEFENGDFSKLAETVCSFSHLDLVSELTPYLRSALYAMAHDPRWGPENTILEAKKLVGEHTSCEQIYSPFWLAIDPGLLWAMDEKISSLFVSDKNVIEYYFWSSTGPRFQIPNALHESLPLEEIRPECLSDDPSGDTWKNSWRCEFDMRLVDEFLQNYSDHHTADYARFMIGDYSGIVAGGVERNPHMYDMAFYVMATDLFRSGQFQEALETYQRFLFSPVFKEHPWRDDARWRIAECYKRTNRYYDALENLAMIKDDGDGILPYYADPIANVIYISDVLMSLDDLRLVVYEEHFPSLQPLLKYTLAERLLAARDFNSAKTVFIDVVEESGDRAVSYDSSGSPILLADLASKKLKVIDTLTGYDASDNIDMPILLAEYLEIYETFSPFENELRMYYPFFIDDYWQPVTEDYVKTRSRHYVSAELRKQFISDYPDDERNPELLLKIGDTYAGVASWAYLPDSKDFLAEIRERAVEAYLTYLEQYPNRDQAEFDRALENAGALYITRCHKELCDSESVLGMRDVYTMLVSKYPDHRLANNMLNWIAWSYCWEAHFIAQSDEEYQASYREALRVYDKIIREYPEGAIGDNARNNVGIIRAKLSDPDARDNMPAPIWEW